MAKEREQLLKGAKEVHKFVRDASETNDRMNEKVRGEGRGEGKHRRE